MIEAIAFGFLAYFGTEVGEYTHEQYDEHIKCRIMVCEEAEPPEQPPEQIITIKIEHNGNVMSETQLGASNE